MSHTIDLFAAPVQLPSSLTAIIESYPIDLNYKQCASMLKEFKARGYSFQYGLDAVPYKLKKITI